MDNDHQVSKYDRIYHGLHDVCLKTKASTIKNVAFLGSESFIVQTMRLGAACATKDQEEGDYVFVELQDASGLTRVVLPPKVVNTIVSQRESLTSRNRSIKGKASAKARMERGELPGFMRKGVKIVGRKG